MWRIAILLCIILLSSVLICSCQKAPSLEPDDNNGNDQDGEVPNNNGDSEDNGTPDDNDDPVDGNDPSEPDQGDSEIPPTDDSPKPPPEPSDDESDDEDDEDVGFIGDLSYDATTGIDSNGNSMVLNTSSILLLVNKTRNLPSDYSPSDLVKPRVRFSFDEDIPKRYLRKSAAVALEKLFEAAGNAGHRIYGVSGYRSYATQKSIFERNAAEKGEEVANRTSARPGQSEHQTGLAMDISSAAANYRLLSSFGTTPEGIWVRENAHRFGFIIRYPKGKEEITGYSYEPWHLRYVGKEAARYIYNHSLTLEEYFQSVYDYPSNS